MPGELLVDEPADGVLRLTIANPGQAQRARPRDPRRTRRARWTAPRRARACVAPHRRTTGMFSSGYDIGDIPDDVFAERGREARRPPVHRRARRARRAATSRPSPRCRATRSAAAWSSRCPATCASPPTAIKLGMPPAKLGLVYSHTGLRRFLDAIGEPRTRELFLLGRNVDARRRTAGGWSPRSWPTTPSRARSRLGGRARRQRAALGARQQAGPARAAARAGAAEIADELEASSIALREACFASEDFREGVRAFGEKRPARWQGAADRGSVARARAARCDALDRGRRRATCSRSAGGRTIGVAGPSVAGTAASHQAGDELRSSRVLARQAGRARATHASCGPSGDRRGHLAPRADAELGQQRPQLVLGAARSRGRRRARRRCRAR